MTVKMGKMSELRYSEAIRLGSVLGPQGFGLSTNRRDGSLCANDAAMAAANLISIFQFPVAEREIACPVCELTNMLAGVVAVCLNDEHEWSRERIADWVESVEREQEAAQSVCADENLCSAK